jgi:hypothetical protein
MQTVEISDTDLLPLRLLANEWGTTVAAAIHRLLEDYSQRERRPINSAPGALLAHDEGAPDSTPIHAIYNGERINGRFYPSTSSVEIVDGRLAGQTFKSPSGAAIAIVHEYNPGVHPNRNGWTFFAATDTGEMLQSLRRKK